MRVFASVAELADHGGDLGRSEWLLLDQDRIDRYAAAVRGGGGADAITTHRYLALALIPLLSQQIWRMQVAMAVNAGLNAIRFGPPIPAGASIQLHSAVVSVRPLGAGALVVTRERILTDQSEDPCVTAEAVTLFRS